MKFIIGLLAAGLLILPGYTAAAPQDAPAAAAKKPADQSGAQTPAAGEDTALGAELDDLSDESLDARDAKGKSVAAPSAEPEEAADARSSAYDAAAYGDLTAIGPVSLKGGDWVFIEGDERRGWFFDRSMMARNEDGSISYWQLILYNDLGKAQFAEAMHDADYEKVAYTLQRRVLSPKENTIRTYEIIAYDGANAVITEGDRDGHAAEIRPDTMAARERDAVKKAARKIK